MRAHAESINLEFEDDITEAEARELLSAAPGVSIIDDRCASCACSPTALPCLVPLSLMHHHLMTAASLWQPVICTQCLHVHRLSPGAVHQAW